MIDRKAAKQAAANAALKYIENGMFVGIGSGSTVTYFIEALGQRCQEGLSIKAVASSVSSEKLAAKVGIPLVPNNTMKTLDIAVDGADEVDSQFHLIKGGGGALLRENIVIQSSRKVIIIIDSAKRVERLGRFPLALEVAQFGYKATMQRLEQGGWNPIQRMQDKDLPFITDNGNFIFDLHYTDGIIDPADEDRRLKDIAGVLETGLFAPFHGVLVVGDENGNVEELQTYV